MRKVKLDDLQEGMVVAADVKNLDDMLLIPAGSELTARHIRILRTWGIPEVAVETGGEGEENTDPLLKLAPETAAKLESDVRSRFWKLDGTNPAQKELLRLTLRRAARQLLGQT